MKGRAFKRDNPEDRDSSSSSGDSANSNAPTLDGGTASTAQAATLVGTTVSHYEIRERLGAGGMGEVYAAYDLTLQRNVALKAIHAERRLQKRSRARFLREARVLSKLDHAHICRIFDYVEGDDSDFLVLELIEGDVLSEAMARALPKAEKLVTARQIVEALVSAHAAGIVHRDLKPSNVMLTERDGVKVLDFGLAWWGDELEPRSDESTSDDPEDSESRFETQAGHIVGTLAYMSPEQARGEPAQTASDMYSLGLVLHELFAENEPYGDGLDRLALVAKARNGDTLPPEGTAADLTDLIQRLKSPAASRRPTAVETAERLRFIQDKPKRRLRRLAVASVLIGIALGGLKYTVDLRHERAIADQRREQAETLVEFMLGDLRSKLEPMGRLDVLDDVGDEAMNYFAAVPESQLSDDELSSRSKALYQIGEVRLLQDDADLSAALTAFEESLALSKALVDGDPENAERRFELSQSHFWVGYVHWQRRELDDALTHFREYLSIARWLVEKEPTNPDWQLELSYANSNIGSVHEARGELEQALERYLETLSINEQLVEEDPENPDWKEQLAESHNLTGVVQLRLGNLDAAAKHFDRELESKEELVATDPGNFGWVNGIANSHSWAGQVHLARGEMDHARMHFMKNYELTKRLVDRDPSNTRHQRNLGRTHFALSRLHIAEGRDAEALAQTRAALGVLRPLEHLDPTNALWRLDVATAHGLLARISFGIGDSVGGREALSAATEYFGTQPTARRDPSELASRAEALSLLTELEHPLPDWAAPVQEQAAGSRDVRVLDPWVRTLVHSGRHEEAVAMIQRLDEIGYRNPNFIKFLNDQGMSREHD